MHSAGKRFCAQTCAQQQQILHTIQAGGGAAGFSRQRQDKMGLLRCVDHLTQKSDLIITKSLDIFGRYLFSFHFCVYCTLKVSSTPPLARGKPSGGFIPGGQVEQVCRNCGASDSDMWVHTFTPS